MSNCGGTIKNKCGTKVYGECVEIQTAPPIFSTLYEEKCVSAEESFIDVYSLIETIKEEIDVSTLENTCITFIEPKTPSSVIEQMYDKICELSNLLIAQEELITTMRQEIDLLQSETCP
jgi:hypothetical protein